MVMMYIRVQKTYRFARVAQSVEHNLAKVGVASSNLVSRSNVNLKKGPSVSLSGTLSPGSHITVS